MNTLQNAPVNEQTFVQFLFNNKRNRIILYLSAPAIIIQFVIFKYLYPFANYIHGDSFGYLKAADENLTIFFHPIGYSKFLRLVSVFAKPDWVLVSLQYLMIQCSSIFLLFTIFYFYKAGRVTQTILLCFMVFNPLVLHLSNMVSSDGLFLALSMTWFALLLWIIYNPSNKILFWHANVLFAAFIVRHNALIYPFISLFTFWLSKLSLRKKLTGLGFGLLLCGWFVGLTIFQYKKLTGYWQYSPFSGWQLANNAMYAYWKVPPQDRKPVPLKFRALDNMISKFYDSHSDSHAGEVSTVFMWTQRFPLMLYLDSLYNSNDRYGNNFKKWASIGPFYSSYGLYITKKYPLHFLRYYIWPNSRNYLSPPVEYLTWYNGGYPAVAESAVKWFGYSNNQVTTRMKSGIIWSLQYYPILISITNVILFLMFLSYLLLKGWQHNTTFNKGILLAGLVWIANAGFTIAASSAALRFQSFPALISATFSLLLIDWMTRLIQHLKLQNQLQHSNKEYSQKASA
ncbi:MAG TPA: hypothetical protein VIM79_22595 [Niastella sp.]